MKPAMQRQPDPTVFHLFLSAAFLFGLAACSSSKPQMVTAAPKTESRAPPPPAGPTRTDFKTIAKSLVQRCVAGGWISRWRATQPDIDIAKPKIYLRDFEDRTEQNLDPAYLTSELDQKMRLSGVYEMVSSGDGAHFIGRGKLMRLAERTSKGDRVSVYTAVLELIDPQSERVAYSCEATVRGEM